MSKVYARSQRGAIPKMRCHLVFVLVLVLVLLSPRRALAGERKILVARPHVATGVTLEHQETIMSGIYRGLTAADAYSVGEGDIADDLKAAGVSSLDTKAASMKVAKAIGAYAVLRYEAKRVGEKLKVRVALFTTQTGHLAFLDKIVDVGGLEDAAESMTRTLLQGGTTPEHVPEGGGGAKGSSSSPASAPTGARSEPSAWAKRLFAQPNAHAAGAFVLEAQVGLAAPLGDDADVMTVGLRAGATLGWQLRLADYQSILLGARFTLARTAFMDELIAALVQSGINATDGAFLNLGALAGARYTLHLASFSVWTGFYLGLAWAQMRLWNTQDSVSDSKAGLGIAWELGGHYMIVPHFGVGLFMDVVGGVVGTISGADFSATSFGLGLSLRTVF